MTSLFHTLHSVFLFLSSNFFLLLHSVWFLFPLLSLLLTPLYLHLLSLGLWPQKLFLIRVLAFMPASFPNATVILQTFFLKPHNSLNSSNFLKTSIFYSTSVCCFVFLAFDLWTAFALAFVHALFVSKDLQVALTLVQGVYNVVLKGCKRELHTGTNKTMMC